MTPDDARAVLAKAAAFDNRTPSQFAAAAWAEALADTDAPLADALAAVTVHYRESREWLMPVHVIEGVERIARARRATIPPVEELMSGIDLDHPDWMRLRRAREAAVLAGADYRRVEITGGAA